MTIRMFSWTEALQVLAPAWIEMVRNLGLNPSHDPRWMDAVVRSHGISDETRVAAWFQERELVGILPFRQTVVRRMGLPLRTVAPVTNLVSYHAGLIASCQAEQLLAETLRQAGAGGWDLLHFNNVPADSATGRTLEAFARQHGSTIITQPGETSPYIRITTDWDQFLATRTKKFRANVTRATRRMADAGETGMEWTIGTGDTDRLLTRMLAVEAASWKAESGIAISQSTTERDYHAQLLPALAGMQALFANVLLVKDRPAAYVLGCRYNGWVGQLKTSFDRQIADAGARVIDASVRRAFDEQADVYDFLGDAAPHKLKWTSDLNSHSNYWIYSRGLAARIAGGATRLLDRIRRRGGTARQNGGE